MSELLTPVQLEAAIRQVGAERYHNKHPFHHLLHGGELNKGQVQAWALNRYCYQAAVPRKDAALMSRVLDRGLRREWVHRLLDHDGYGGEEGGIERWLVLTDALGLDREYVTSMRGALPATDLAVVPISGRRDRDAAQAQQPTPCRGLIATQRDLKISNHVLQMLDPEQAAFLIVSVRQLAECAPGNHVGRMRMRDRRNFRIIAVDHPMQVDGFIHVRLD